MTREQLLDLICPTDVPKECEDGKSNCNICFEAMNKWLDEYKKQIINDFVEAYQHDDKNCWSECDKDLNESFCCMDCFKERYLNEHNG